MTEEINLITYNGFERTWSLLYTTPVYNSRRKGGRVYEGVSQRHASDDHKIVRLELPGVIIKLDYACIEPQMDRLRNALDRESFDSIVQMVFKVLVERVTGALLMSLLEAYQTRLFDEWEDGVVRGRKGMKEEMLHFLGVEEEENDQT